MNKISAPQVGQMMKLASASLRALSEDNQVMREKLAFYEKKDRAEKLASAMSEKNIEPELSHTEKVAGIMRRENLDVLEEAVGMAAPQMKIASVHDNGVVSVEGGASDDGSFAGDRFAASLLSID